MLIGLVVDNMTIDPVVSAFFIASGVLITGYIAALALDKYGIPDPILLISVGILIGPMLGLIDPSRFQGLAVYLGALAFVAIMFESSLGINIHELMGSAKAALTLALTSFTLSVISVMLVVHFLFGYSIIESALFGSIIGGSSGAVVAAVVSKLSLEPPTPLILSIESLLTDVFCIVSYVVLKWVITSPQRVEEAASFVASKFSTSAVLGFIFGLLLASAIYKLRKQKHNYTAIFSSLIFLYALSEYLGGNGAIAVLTAGIILTNIEYLPSYLSSEERIETIKFQRIFIESFHSELTLIIKVFFFVEIGLLFQVINVFYLLVATLFALILFIVRVPAALVASKAVEGKSNPLVITCFYARGLAAAVLAVDVVNDPSLAKVMSDVTRQFFIQTASGVVFVTNLLLTVVYLVLKKYS